jgi:hypothetical protein
MPQSKKQIHAFAKFVFQNEQTEVRFLQAFKVTISLYVVARSAAGIENTFFFVHETIRFFGKQKAHVFVLGFLTSHVYVIFKIIIL